MSNKTTNTGAEHPETQTDSNGELIISDNPEIEVKNTAAKIHAALEKSGEVKALAEEVDLKDHETILQFGAKPAHEISSFADRILKQVKKDDVEDSGRMLTDLAKLMKTFDPKDFEKDEGGFLSKLFGGAKKVIEKILAKYQTIGGEIDKIYREISKYKGEISKTNKMLEQLYQENFSYFQQIERYIVAGNILLSRLKAEELPKLEERAENGQQIDVIHLENFKNGIEMLEGRVYDLEMGKMVALQTAPQIRMIQKGNYKLISKIQSAFVVTIPIFKNGLIQAITLKRQKLVADSMEALDNATNELLLKNAQNTALQSAQIAKLSQGAVSMETLEKTWQTILKGIDDTKAIEEANKKARIEGTNRLHSLQDEILQKFKQ